MPRRAAGLTALKVSKAKPGRYGDGRGLYLLVRAPQARFWLFRYRLAGGRMREMGLGSVADVTLAEAREKAETLYKAVRAGNDPLAERAAAAQASRTEAQRTALQSITFGHVADAYIAAHEASWRNAKHRQQWRNTLDTYAAPVFGDLPIAELDTAAVMKVLEPIWRDKPETASRLRGRIESVVSYATARGWRTGENPARWKGHLDNLLPARGKVAQVEHHAALPWREIGNFMVLLAQQEGVAALALRFAILTAARTGEVIGATWSEIDMEEALWTVPAARMKAKREHRVPLAPDVMDLLRRASMLRLDDDPNRPVFPGPKLTKGLSNMAMLALLRRMGRGDLTAHGFRSTFRDWCAESTNYPREVAEAVLAHTVGNKVEAAYRRGDLMDKRRRLMTDWATFCARTSTAADVIPMRGGAA
jgi:integrase